MKKLSLIFTLLIAVGLTSCSKDINETEEGTEELNSKALYGTYESYTCWVYEGQFPDIIKIQGEQCSESINSTCSTPHPCLPIVASLREFAISHIPKLNVHNWGGHFALSRNYDVALAFWMMNPSTYMHPDSMVFSNPSAHH